MKFLLGKKLEMSQIFKDDKVIPVTQIEAGPCLVTQIKTKDKDKYEAIQIGYQKITKVKKIKKTMKGKEFKYLREFPISNFQFPMKIGDEIKVEVFKPGDIVQVSGTSKGKGFAGVVKRHGFHGQPSTHGHKDQARMPGSIGATAPQRVFKGKKMPGRMGGERVTVKNLEVIEVNQEKNLLVVKGAVPGARGTLLEIKN